MSHSDAYATFQAQSAGSPGRSKRGYRRAVAWFGGAAAVALWIYSGMPMICH